MVLGSDEHQRLEAEFLTEADLEFTLEEALEESKQSAIRSRELYVQDESSMIRGYIDEVIFSPAGLMVIDDKPVGKSGKVYDSSKNQVFGYCLALKRMLSPDDSRQITGAVRERGTETIAWSQTFDQRAERTVKRLSRRLHGLVSGSTKPTSSKEAYKCRPCRFFGVCDRRVEA